MCRPFLRARDASWAISPRGQSRIVLRSLAPLGSLLAGRASVLPSKRPFGERARAGWGGGFEGRVKDRGGVCRETDRARPHACLQAWARPWRLCRASADRGPRTLVPRGPVRAPRCQGVVELPFVKAALRCNTPRGRAASSRGPCEPMLCCNSHSKPSTPSISSMLEAMSFQSVHPPAPGRV